MADTITVENAGPIEGVFEIDLSQGPGVYELRGARGTGKTTAIASIDWLAGHKVDVTLHDGEVSGSVTGFGVVAPIGGRKRRKGDLALDTIDAEKFSLTDLIDPPGKTPDVRDAHVIKALAVLSGVKGEPSLYYDLAGGQSEFDQLGLAATDDPVLLARRVKDAFDSVARIKARAAESEVGHAVPLEHVPDGLDLSAPCDMTVLGNVRDEARDNLQALKDARTSGEQREQEVATAKGRLETIQAEYKGTTSQEAEKSLSQAKKNSDAANAKVEDLLAQLAVAREAAMAADHAVQLDVSKRDAAVQHERAVEALRQTANAVVEYPAESAIAKAQQAVDSATIAYDTGVRVRDVKQNQAKAKTHRDIAAAAERVADEAKNKASQVFDRLAGSLQMQHLTVQPVDGSPRIFVQHPKRGKTLFDRVNGLSDGERVDFSLRELLPHIESPGLLPIPQRVWQDLQPSDREGLHTLAKNNGLYIFGAQVDDGALRVVYLGENSDEPVEERAR